VPARRLAAGWQALSALSLLTVIPLPRRAHRLPTAVTLAAFAPVGLLIGGLLAGLDAALTPVLAVPARSAVLLAAAVATTGAMHLDGLIDTADGIFLRGTAASRREVMHDSHAGSFGVAAAVVVVLAQYGALVTLGGARLQGLVAAAVLARAAMALTLAVPPSAGQGLAAAYSVRGGRVAAALSMSLAAAAAVLLAGTRGAAASAAAALVAALVATLFVRRAGGISGDGCGAAGELAFTVTLLTLGART